jgi:hypothetical protein
MEITLVQQTGRVASLVEEFAMYHKGRELKPAK